MTARSAFPNVVIRASAGTGKTFQLSNRFLGLVAAGEPLDSILATTFTRKAAGEILARVLSRLAEAVDDPDALIELGQQLAGAGGREKGDRPHLCDDQRCASVPAEGPFRQMGAVPFFPAVSQAPCARGRSSSADSPEVLREACLAMLRALVRHIHRLRIGTLDSFFVQIARSFSLELGLPPGWEIVDEVVDQNLRAEALRAMLRDQSTSDVVRLVQLLTKGEARRSVSQQLFTLVQDLYAIYLEAPREAWECIPRRKTLAPADLEAAIGRLAALVLEGKQATNARDAAVANCQAEDWEAFLSKGYAAKLLAGETEFYRKPISQEIRDAFEPLIAHAKAELLGQIANQTAATWRCLDHFHAAYGRLKIARRGLRFEDLTRRLADVALAERIDEVVYRLDGHLAHLLLDEFQDTSPLQWRVVRGLARRAVERGGRGSFFCVGDVKQAIYGWRGGVAEIFDAVGAELPHVEAQALNRSWRSAPEVIDTVNRVFEGLKANPCMAKYADAAEHWAARFEKHSTVKTALSGYCRLLTAPAAGETEDQTTRTLQFAADEIARLHREAPDRSLGVLVRRNAAVARLIFELRQRGVEASEEGGNPLTDSPAVQLIVSLLTLADHPGDTCARFHVATSPLGATVGLASHEDTAAACRLAREIRWRLLTEGYGPVVYGWVAALAPHCDRRQLGRLMKLVELAYAHQAQATTRTSDFLDVVRQKRVEDPAPAAVRVMTVHQAKGLEFDCVVLPELDYRIAGQPPQIVVDRPAPAAPVNRVCRYVSQSLRGLLPADFGRMFEAHERQVVEESLCVLYVALTRAARALHIIIAPSAASEKNVPSKVSGLLRCALVGPDRLEPGRVYYEHGDPQWLARGPAARPVAEPAGAAARGELRLAPSPAVAIRGLERRSPSQLEGGVRVDLVGRLGFDTAARGRGNLLHAWFEQIAWLEDGCPDDAALRQIAGRPEFAGLDVEELVRRFHAMLESPAIRAALARPKVAAGSRVELWRERAFAIRDADAILQGRIDRLAVHYQGDRAVRAELLDYKSDTIPPGDAAALAVRVEVYRPQLEAYRRAVAQLFRLPPEAVACRLAFLDPGTVVDVKDERAPGP